jgi:hypothetical protein
MFSHEVRLRDAMKRIIQVRAHGVAAACLIFSLAMATGTAP